MTTQKDNLREEKIDAILAEYFTWRGEAIHEVNQTANYQRMKSKLTQALEREKQGRIKRNKSFCGCPMCLHHTKAYELRQSERTE